MYKVYYETKDSRMDRRQGTVDFLLSLISSALVLITVSTLFKYFYINNIVTAVIAAFLVTILNKTIKPVLFILTLPVTIITLGLFYPIVNMIVLNIVDFFLGDAFIIDGFFTLFFASILISILNMLMTSLVLDQVKRNGRY